VVPHHPLGTNGESRRITELIEGAPATEKETNSSAGEIQTNTELMDSMEVTTDTTTGTGTGPTSGDRDTTVDLQAMTEDQVMAIGTDTIVGAITTFTTLGNRITTGDMTTRDMRWAEGATSATTIGGATWEELAIIREMIIAIRWIAATWYKGKNLIGNKNKNENENEIEIEIEIENVNGTTTNSIISDVDTTTGTTFVINATATPITTTVNAILAEMLREERIETSVASTPIMFVGLITTRGEIASNSSGKGS